MDQFREPPEEVRLIDFLYYIRRYQDGIYVRVQVDGRWTNAALSELNASQWAEYINRWLAEGVWPLRVREPQEMEQP